MKDLYQLLQTPRNSSFFWVPCEIERSAEVVLLEMVTLSRVIIQQMRYLELCLSFTEHYSC